MSTCLNIRCVDGTYKSGQEAILTKPTEIFLLCFASCQHVFICYDRERTRANLPSWMLFQQRHQIKTWLRVWWVNRSPEKFKGSFYSKLTNKLVCLESKGWCETWVVEKQCHKWKTHMCWCPKQLDNYSRPFPREISPMRRINAVWNKDAPAPQGTQSGCFKLKCMASDGSWLWPLGTISI